MRSALVLLAGLIVLLMGVGCSLGVAPWGVEAVTPSAMVDLSPSTFCVGELLTVTYAGGHQVASCDPEAPDSSECKGASLTNMGAALSFPFGFADSNLFGSVSDTAKVLDTIGVTYFVEWEAWSHYRELRVQSQPGSGSPWTGRIQALDSAEPILEGGRVLWTDALVCDEETHTVRFGHRASAQPSFQRPNRSGGWRPTATGELSACAAIDQICISDLDANYVWRLSVEGGPSVELGGPDNPPCTDTFRGYQPQDISLESPSGIGYGGAGSLLPGAPCTPGDPDGLSWPGVPIVEYYVAGSNMCDIDHEYGDLGRWDGGSLEQFDFGSIPLQGAARERCLTALDPGFVANLPLVPVSVTEGEAPSTTPSFPIVIDDGSSDGESGIVTICDLNTTCGNNVCEEGCENVNNCSQDCATGSGVCDNAAKVETFPVYDCTYGDGGWTYYEGLRCYDADGVLLFDGHTGGPFTSAEWLSYCPAAPGQGDNGGGNQQPQPPSCKEAPNDPNCIP